MIYKIQNQVHQLQQVNKSQSSQTQVPIQAPTMIRLQMQYPPQQMALPHLQHYQL